MRRIARFTQPKRRFFISATVVLILVALLIISLSIATAPGRTAVKTALFLPQIMPGLPVRPQEWFTRAPNRVEARYATRNGNALADLYVPASGSEHSAVLLFLGVNPAGRDDPRVVGLAEALARSGTVVMIPWSDTMTQRRIALEEVDNLVYAFQYLRSLDIVDENNVGMGGFCVGASLSTVAAEDPRINEHVRFVNFFGGYYDAVNLLKAVASRSRFYGGDTEPWNPARLAVDVVASHLVEGIPSDAERELLHRALVTREEDIRVDPESLSREAQAVYALLNSPAIGDIDGLIAELPEATLDSLRFISPSTRLDNLKARVLIMHDREDTLVPAEESRRMADALAARGDVYHTEFSLFQHLDPTRPVGPAEFIRESFKLYMHMYNVLRELG